MKEKIRKSTEKKIIFLVVLFLVWVLFGLIIKLLVMTGYIHMLPPEPNEFEFNNNVSNIEESMTRLRIAEDFVYNKLVEENGHVNLYYLQENFGEEDYETIEFPYRTNSEAASYYLLWNVKVRNKPEFDRELEYIKNYMLKEEYNYMMWRLEADDKPITDGDNIAPDADLRAIKALYDAKETWGDEEYSEMIEILSSGLEKVAVSEERYFVPYGGVENGEIWRAEVVWLSYSNFEAFRELALDRKEPWISVYDNMKKAVLESQLENGLFNPVINENGDYVNTLEEGYSINSMWVMVRAAESKDIELQEAARKSLNFYKFKYREDGKIASSYDANGVAIAEESVWAYALTGRTAIELGDNEFAKEMIDKMLEKQNTNTESDFFGGFPEGNPKYVSQFTMQESIITLQNYIEKSLENKEGQ